ncbi:MAG: Cupin domain protein [Firmicutes bacterium ADurb.Bin193]|nr:MAG: Cupin domain protein [Firmicutes bacterium ADurb.Bin193]
MSENIKLIAKRLKELREIREISAQTFAKMLNTDINTYLEYESGETDIPVSFLYEAAGKLDIDLTTLLTGQQPKLQMYSYVKNGEGLDVERSKQYKYKNLAYNFLNKKAEPFLVTVDPLPDDVPISLNSHPGQEMDYVLEGTVVVKIGESVLTLSEGDTLFYDSNYPHGMKAVGNKPAKFLAIIF